MLMKIFFVSCLFTLGLTASTTSPSGLQGLNCKDCKLIANVVGSLFRSEGGINASTEYVRKPVCDAMPAELECEKNIGWFWRVLSTWIFSTEGWFAPKYFCMDVCPVTKTSDIETENEIDVDSESDKERRSGPSCKDCSQRLFANIAFMSHKDILDEAVDNLKKAKFCETYAETKDLEKCNKALEIVVPVGLTALSKSGDLWIEFTCEKDIKCSN
eukprot:TRINITY_DN14947_c0_g1_i2.p1 TRINITY_DN14947_c0_g1~~TRINITY_DN14947_c0_g1_i2.p1  ORF type:complete len:215 (-),score=49.76 TRINITY_DN14947_c0_g1_i2:264-908(-)